MVEGNVYLCVTSRKKWRVKARGIMAVCRIFRCGMLTF